MTTNLKIKIFYSGDPCDECRNDPLSITDTWAGQCFANGEGSSCNCVCGDVFCFDGEVIDRSTCISGGRLQDCKCIATATTAPTTVPPTQGDPFRSNWSKFYFIFPSENVDHFIGCEWCLNSKLSVGDTFAGHCFPNTSQGECYCLCADVFCKEGEIIDRTTCVEGGSINNCKCIVIDSHASTTTSTSMPLDS